MSNHEFFNEIFKIDNQRTRIDNKKTKNGEVFIQKFLYNSKNISEGKL